MSPQDPNLYVVPDIQPSTRSSATRASHPRRKIERRRSEADYAMKSETLHIIHKLAPGTPLYEREVDYVVQRASR